MKYESHCGWPAFSLGNKLIKEIKDLSLGRSRIEIQCDCGSHLGHVFNDGPPPSGLRYCVNSESIKYSENI